MAISGFNELQTRIHMTLEALSNNDGALTISETLIEEAGEQYKAALRKQLTPRKEGFRLRMSNIGRPLCQLQKEQSGAPASRRDYSFVVKMFIGDAVEIAMMAVLKMAGINISGEKTKVELLVNGNPILGEDDLEIDSEVWDIKSSSNWAFNNKWAHGWNSVYDGDTFGYVSQLYGYAKAQNKAIGGWIVVNKETGEVLVVRAEPTPDQLKAIQESIEFTEKAISSNLPFKRQFQDEAETFYKKETGNRVLPIPCTFCDYRGDCWPDAVRKPQALSKAQNPKLVWYSKYTKSDA